MNALKRKTESSILIIFLFIHLFSNNTFAQTNADQFSILFYNVENLFDVQDNPETEDDTFTPEGDMHWTSKRLSAKLLNLSKAILSTSEWNVPDVVVFAEIENKDVLEKLIRNTPLKSFPYKIIHKESPDHRGIDVGMIYNTEHFSPIEYKYHPINIKENILNSREIFYVSGVANGADTIHIFGNHWPSRYSGLLETKELRKAAAMLLREKINEIQSAYKSPKIVILGDFNDNPEDETLTGILKAGTIQTPVDGDKLYNLFFDINRVNQGSMKFQSQWFIFDQIIVSGSLLTSGSGIYALPENAKIVALPFLLEDDKKFGGKKPFRTYYGFTYNGGFSDHLPILLKLNSAN